MIRANKLPQSIRLLVALQVFSLATFIGCSNRGDLPHTVPVTGKVTYKNQPVAAATVSFIGEENLRPAVAITEPDGTYSLKTLDADGAMPGKYKVLVEKNEVPPELLKEVSMEDAAKMAGRPPPAIKKLLPAKYADATKTPFTFEVKDGDANEFNLPLAD